MQVDGDEAGDLTLRLLDPGVAGADDLVDARDRLRAVGERRDRLGTAEGEQPVRPGDGAGGGDRRRRLAVGCRRRHDDHLRDAGGTGRYDAHQHAAGVGEAPAGRVHADAAQWHGATLEQHARARAAAHRARTARRVPAPERGAAAFERFQGVRRDRRTSVTPSVGGDLADELRPVVTQRELGQRGVAGGTHAREDLTYPRREVVAPARRTSQRREQLVDRPMLHDRRIRHARTPHGANLSIDVTRMPQAPSAFSRATIS